MKLKQKLLFLMVFFVFSVPISGQIKVYKVESTQVKEFKVGSKTNFSITTNKADIVVIPSANEMIKITAVLSSKNAVKQLAENDLRLLKFIIEKKINTISIVNYVELENGEKKPSSNLHSYYTIEIPKSATSDFKIKNEFGKIEFSNIEANASIEGKFCPIAINNYNGNIKLEAYYGDVALKNITGELSLNSIHSKLDIENHFGNFTIQSSFSKINLVNITPDNTSKIVDKHSEINLSQSCLSCNYILFDLEKSEFNLPDQVAVSYTIKEELKIIGSIFKTKPKRIIDIKSNTGIVSLKALSN